MTQILKSIFKRQTRSIALFIEIVIVTIIGWIIIEPVAVNTTTALIPAGYDHDRLVMLTIDFLNSKSTDYDESAENMEKKQPYENLLRMIRQRPGVEKATFSFYQSFEMNGRSSNGLQADSTYKEKGIEDISLSMTCIDFLPNTDFFSTFGIKDVNGNDFQEPEMSETTYIISQSVAKALFPDSTAIGKEVSAPLPWRPYAITAAGVTADVPYNKGDGRIGTYYIARDWEGWSRPAGICHLYTSPSPRDKP